MKNILNDSDYDEIKKRIIALPASSPRQWGKMDLQQMLVHCTRQLKLALGEVSAEEQGPSFMRSRFVKWMIFSNLSWPKGAVTPFEMDVKKNNFPVKAVDAEKDELLKYLEQARKEEQLKPHPFFGNLNRKEWSRLIYKHLDHHLKQFGSK